MAKANEGVKAKLMEILEQNKAPAPLDVELPAWVVKPDDENAIEMLAAQMYSHHYNAALKELDNPEKAVKSAEVRSKIAAEAMQRVLQNLDASSEVIERATAYLLYMISETGLWTHDITEPATIEEWLVLRLSDEKISRTYRVYYNFLLTTLIPHLRAHGTPEQIEALFVVKDNWRKAQATIPELRKAIDLVTATESVFAKKIEYQAQELNQISNLLMSTELSGPERNQVEREKEKASKKLAELRSEAESKIATERKDIGVLVDVATKLISSKGSLTTDAVKQKLYQEFSEQTGKTINPQYVPKTYKGTICHLHNDVVFYVHTPKGLVETVEAITRDTIDWTAGDHDRLLVQVLNDIPTKQSARLLKAWIKNLGDEESKPIIAALSGLWE